MKIIYQHLVPTEYGLNMVCATDDGKYYQQQHETMEYNGGGAAVWVKIDSMTYDKITKNVH